MNMQAMRVADERLLHADRDRQEYERKLLEAAGWTRSRIGAVWLWSRDWTFHHDRLTREQTGTDSHVERISVDQPTALYLTRAWLLKDDDDAP